VAKVIYAMLIIILLLMMWASVARTHELLPVQYPPCFFDPLCTCSKAIPDLGIVACYNVPLARIPQPINSSKVFMLRLENNGLRFLQPRHLANTGTLRRVNKVKRKRMAPLLFLFLFLVISFIDGRRFQLTYALTTREIFYSLFFFETRERSKENIRQKSTKVT